jgi:hypothetical protein
MLALSRNSRATLSRLSSLSPTLATSTNSNSNTSQPPQVIDLYKRHTNLPFWSVHNPSPVLGFTTVHLGYWSWYNLFYNPYLLEHGIMIDQRWGYAGMGLSVFMCVGAAAFTTHLISGVEYLKSGPGVGYLRFRTHSLPFGLPQTGPDDGKVYKVGSIALEVNSTLAKKTTEPQQVLHKGNGYQAFQITDESMAKYSLNYLVDVDFGDLYEGGGKGYKLVEKILIDGIVPAEKGGEKSLKTGKRGR